MISRRETLVGATAVAAAAALPEKYKGVRRSLPETISVMPIIPKSFWEWSVEEAYAWLDLVSDKLPIDRFLPTPVALAQIGNGRIQRGYISGMHYRPTEPNGAQWYAIMRSVVVDALAEFHGVGVIWPGEGRFYFSKEAYPKSLQPLTEWMKHCKSVIDVLEADFAYHKINVDTWLEEFLKDPSTSYAVQCARADIRFKEIACDAPAAVSQWQKWYLNVMGTTLRAALVDHSPLWFG